MGNDHLQVTTVFACRRRLTQSEDTPAHGRVSLGGWGQKPTCGGSRSEAPGFHNTLCVLTANVTGVAGVAAKRIRLSPKTAAPVHRPGCDSAETPGPGCHPAF